MKQFILLVLLLWPVSGYTEEITVELNDGAEIPLEHVKASGDRMLVWLPSEFGVSTRQQAVAEALSQAGTEVWMADFHSAYFIPPGRYSLETISASTLLELLQKLRQQSAKQIYLFASGRMAATALSAVHLWQQQGLEQSQLGGVILVGPKLYTQTPQGGEEATFIPVARATSVPVYLFQPENTAQFWRIKSVMQTLEEGGAQVYLHKLTGVADGFHLRPLDRTEPAELQMTERLPQMLNSAMRLLSVQQSDYAAVPLPQVAPEKVASHQSDLLKAYQGEHFAPALKLATLDGDLVDLADYKGKVVVLNYWATWCPPCVAEIPSLDRLRVKMQPDGVEVISVDVGEDEAAVRAFLADKPIGFPVLLDPTAKAFTDWHSYAFPTTFVLDRQHKIRYAVFGAFEWDSEEVIKTLKALLESS